MGGGVDLLDRCECGRAFVYEFVKADSDKGTYHNLYEAVCTCGNKKQIKGVLQ